MTKKLLENGVAKSFAGSIVAPMKWDWKCIRLLALLAVQLLIPKIRDTGAPLPKPAADPTGELPYE